MSYSHEYICYSPSWINNAAFPSETIQEIERRLSNLVSAEANQATQNRRHGLWKCLLVSNEQTVREYSVA
jgi:hypothetical protein